VTRLRAQHTELCKKIEGGEGAKAALDALQKENELMKQNIDGAQIKNRELENNIQSLKTELDKLQFEQKRDMASFEKEKTAWKTQNDQLKEDLSRRVII